MKKFGMVTATLLLSFSPLVHANECRSLEDFKAMALEAVRGGKYQGTKPSDFSLSQTVADPPSPEFDVTDKVGHNVHVTCDDSGDDNCECSLPESRHALMVPAMKALESLVDYQKNLPDSAKIEPAKLPRKVKAFYDQRVANSKLFNKDNSAKVEAFTLEIESAGQKYKTYIVWWDIVGDSIRADFALFDRNGVEINSASVYHTPDVGNGRGVSWQLSALHINCQ